MTSLPCHISQTRSPVLKSIPESPKSLGEWQAQQDRICISTTTFPRTTEVREIEGGGPRTFRRDKRALFPSINEIQLVYNCATFITVSQVMEQNETFSGHNNDAKEF